MGMLMRSLPRRPISSPWVMYFRRFFLMRPRTICLNRLRSCSILRAIVGGPEPLDVIDAPGWELARSPRVRSKYSAVSEGGQRDPPERPGKDSNASTGLGIHRLAGRRVGSREARQSPRAR